jgi:catechol 2,3-dioxygenase-like lactoylglutathione lyase family enzyme
VPFIDHVGLGPADMDAALHFYRDGIGLEVLFDVTFDADFEPLLGVPTKMPRTVFLGDPGRPDAGRVELLDLGTGELPDGRAAPGLPHRGACLLSFQVAVEETLQRLADLGIGGEPRRIQTPGGAAAIVVDPDGVMVELVNRAVSY